MAADPARCLHCGAAEPLDKDGYCADFDACIVRQPLGTNRTKATKATKVTCPYCSKRVALTATGKLHAHLDPATKHACVRRSTQ